MRTKKEGAVEDKGIRSGLDNMFSALPVATGCLGHEFKRRTCFEASTWKRNEGREEHQTVDPSASNEAAKGEVRENRKGFFGQKDIMKVSVSRIKELIEEELKLAGILKEVNPSHRPAGAPGGKGGQFTKRGAGNVYSLSKKAKDNVGKDSQLEVPARGKETSGGKVGSMKYGANTAKDPAKQCGGTTFPDGERKSPSRSCSNYPALYELLLDEMKLMEGDACDQCIQSFLARLRRANHALKTARDGDMGK
mgnify:FL=1